MGTERSRLFCADTWERTCVECFAKRGQEDVFPSILCQEIQQTVNGEENGNGSAVQVEPLAADVRGKDRKESLKKLNVEILRLIAAMLGCPYDSLKQRQKEYIIKRTAAFCISGLAVLLCIIGYFGYQQRQIDLQH